MSGSVQGQRIPQASFTLVRRKTRYYSYSAHKHPGSEMPALHQSRKHVVLAQRQEMNETGKRTQEQIYRKWTWQLTEPIFHIIEKTDEPTHGIVRMRYHLEEN